MRASATWPPGPTRSPSSAGIEQAVKAAVESIRQLAKDVDDKAEIAQVASISAADPSIGEVISDAIDKVGKDGVVTVEESNTFGVELEFTEGMQFDKGYISPYFVTDQERQEAVLEDPFILIANSEDQLGPRPHRGPRACHDGRQASAAHSRRRRRRGPCHSDRQQAAGHVPSVAVKAPGFGDRRKAMLADIAILTGGQAISEEVGLKLENTDSRLLGRARKVVIAKDTTTIIEGFGPEADVKARIAQIKREIEDTDSDWDREKLQERLAKLAGGVAVIRVGAATEIELKEKKHRIEDAGFSDQSRHRRGHRPRRWFGPAALPRPRWTSSSRASRATKPPGPRS